MNNSHSQDSTRTAIIPALLNTAEAAQLCNLGERSLWRHSRSGQAPRPVKIGGSVRYVRAELIAWIEAGCPDCRSWTFERRTQSD